MEFILRVDGKGRILIPSEVRSMLGIKGAVSARVVDGKIIIEPIRDPIDVLTSSVIRGTVDVEKEVRKLREVAFKEALRRVEERWS